MRITHKTPVAVAAAEATRRWGNRAERICRKRALSNSKEMWTSIADTIAGSEHWVAGEAQWAHVTNRAVIYGTLAGYEWEVFGKTRGEAATLTEAKQQAEEAIQ